MHVILETGATFLSMHLAREKGVAELAQVLLEEGLALARQQDDKPSMAYALNHLGSLAGMKGDSCATVEGCCIKRVWRSGVNWAIKKALLSCLEIWEISPRIKGIF